VLQVDQHKVSLLLVMVSCQARKRVTTSKLVANLSSPLTCILSLLL
jgi:hypothetical protein